MKQSFLQFTNALRGFQFYSKKTGKFIPLYQLYWANYLPEQVFEMFDKKIRQYESEAEKY